MQSTVSSIQTQSEIIKTMQPQSAQNMYVPSSGTNSTGNIRTNQQAGGMFRGPPASAAPRNGARHMPMQTIYQQTMHQGVQGVVVPTYQQYPPRQPFQAAPQYSFSQPIQQNYYSYPYYTVPQPQPHQRGAVGVNTNVGVGNAISVQAGPNGPMTGPPGATQAQISIAAGTVLASTVAPGTNAVLGVATTAAAQQVGVPPMVGVVQSSVPTPASQKKARRKYAIDIINPNTKKNIFEDEDLEISKNSVSSESEFSDQVIATTAIQSEILTPQQDNSNMSIASGSVIGMTTEARPSLSYNLDIHQITQQRDIVGQTPIVSAISDAPSVEILPSPKPRAKKILSIVPPKETQNAGSSTPQTTETSKPHQQKSNNIEEVINSDCVQQQPQPSPEQYKQIIQVPQQNTQQQVTTVNNECIRVLDSNSTIVDESNISKELITEPTADTKSATANTTTSATDVRHEVSSNKNSICEQEKEIVTSNLVQQQQQEFEASCPTTSSSTTTSTSVSLESKQEITSGSSALLDQDRSLHTMQLTEKETISASNNEQSASTAIVNPSNGVTNRSTIETTVIDEARNNNNNVPTSDISASNNNNRLNKLNDKNENISLNERNLESMVSECDETDRATSTPQTELIQTEINLDKDLANNETDGGNSESDRDTTSTMSIKTSVSDTSITIASTSAGQSNSPTETEQQPLINYNEGQWSPNNPSGKKQYDREQLMQLREAKASRIQPEVNNVSILPQPNLMPSFVRDKNKRVQSMVGSIGGNRGGDSGSGGNFISKQASMSGVHGRGSMKGMIHVNLSLNQDVKLNETDNAWRPRALVKKDEEGDPNIRTKREKDELVRRVRGILNKLTPEKFDALVEEIIKLKIDTPDKMEDVMVLVFEKAIDEPNFSVSYARLCHRLITEVKVQDERMESGTKTNLALFRNALLDKTEREFTQNVTQSSAKEKKLQPIIEKIAKCKDPVEKAEMEALLEEEERKIRRRSGGTVRFIGELFKISMLTGKIIHSCIDTLLNPNSEDMLECMCKLLTTVGAKFEQTQINSKESPRCYSLDKIMARMQAIASKTDKEGTKVSSRVRFMLQDVIDLRKNKWQSTRNEAPKTMEQIEKETKTEQMSSQFLNYSGPVAAAGGSGANGSSMASNKRDDRGGGGRYNDSRSSGGYGGSHSQRGDTGSLRRQQQGNNGGNSNISGGHSNGNNDDNTWTVQTGKSSRSLAVDTNKLEGLMHQNYDIGNKKMGGVSQFIWNNNAARQSATPTTIPSNSFAVLSSLVDSNKNSDRDRDRDRDRSGPRNKGSYNKGSMERDRYGDRGIHSRTGSSQTSRENSSSRGSQGPRGMMNTSSMQKSASHSKYSQQMSTGRMLPKTTVGAGSGSIYGHQRGDQSSSANYSSQHQQSETTNVNTNVAPVAVFEEPTESDLAVIKSVVSEIMEIHANSKTINSSIVLCIEKVKHNQRCGLLYYILSDFLHLRQVGQQQRRHLANTVAYFIEHNHLSVEHFRLAYANFCAIASDLIVDIPGLWLYVFEFTGPLLTKNVITINDLWNKQLKEDSLQSLGAKFLKTLLVYCTREIGPSFTRSMWKNFDLKWADFVPENEVANFIQSNKFEYVENELIPPEIEIKESKEKHIVKVVEHIDHFLKDGSTADCIIDYINGNIVDIDKQFIRSLTTKLCNFAITYNENSYKLDIDCFQKFCIPVLQRYIDSKEERELECLYSMQLLVHSLEHPRVLLSELFGELYDADVIPQDSFIKWRDSKDQSAGKGVAVKGLNPFFNHILTSETSDENN